MQFSRWHKIGVALLLTTIAGFAHALDPVTNTLSVYRIGTSGGQEKAESVASAKPGELLEYVAEFRNNGASTARGLSATLPLPVGTEFVSASQRPLTALGSVDGIKFEALPLKRMVKQADGGSREELVPLRDYRFLRWPATELPVGASLSVSARVTIATNIDTVR